VPLGSDLNPVANILAVVVTYNPGADLAQNLRALRAEVPVVVVDNGSRNYAVVEAAARETGSRLISNGENRGIAAALNEAAHLAVAEGFEWLAAFDQDSLVSQGAFANILATYSRHPARDRIAVISMARRDRGTGQDYTGSWLILEETPDWRSVRTTFTSGSIIKSEIFGLIGFFDEGLFIDAVDHEFALRCRHNKYLIVEDKNTRLMHSLGAPTIVKVLWVKVVLTNYAPIRQYYITRNHLEVVFRAISIDLFWALCTLATLILDNLRACLFESDRWAKLRAIWEGVRDFTLRRFGPRGQRTGAGLLTST
jgi:rhamnosyltransferase